MDVSAAPSAKQPAPGRLAEVQAFLNTRDVGEGSDDLATTASTRDWLRRHGTDLAGPISDSQRQRLVGVREALRELLTSHHGDLVAAEVGAGLDRMLAGIRLEPRLTAEGATLVPLGRGVDAYLGQLAAAILEATVAGTWQRLKVCRLDNCRWAFYDHTKNARGAWCSMRVCGTRAKARAYRARRATDRS
ncbi:MAG: CGNR zinc finger domain-containing protein [Candidatus Dormiibacterota bacterium]